MGAGIGIQAEPARRQLAVDEGGQVLALVAIACDRHGIWRAFDQTAQRGAAASSPASITTSASIPGSASSARHAALAWSLA